MMELQKVSFSAKLTERDSLINDWVLTFNQIENDLKTIKEKEHLITVNSTDMEFTKARKQQILEDIKYINSLLDQNKAKIASLTAQLKNSGATIVGMQAKIAELEASMKQSESDISQLKTNLTQKDFEIGQLNTRMTGMQDTVAQKDEKINLQTNEMNKAFLVAGTYKDLKAKGLVTKEGGFLGLGKKESFRENFADSSFKRIDITVTKTIPVNSKNVRLITEHPASSYQLIRDNNNKIAYIEIVNPDQFWKITKYAVVEIIK
jgi:hypothetical protein